MAQIRFSNSKIRSLKPGDYTDPRYPNLILRAGKRRKTWVHRLRRIGGRRGIRPGTKLGYFPALDLDSAILLYHEEAARQARGEPAPDVDQRIKELERELKALRKASGKLLLFSDLIKTFLRDYVPRKTGRPLAAATRQGYEASLRTVVDVFGTCDASQIGHAEFRDQIETLYKKQPSTGIRLYKTLKTAYGWAFERELVTTNPMARLKTPGKCSERDRFLMIQELVQAWRGFSDISPTVGQPLKFIYLTGQRRTECSFMTWNEISECGEWWHLPKERTKMKEQGNSIFLGPTAQAILDAQRQLGSPYVFPGKGGLKPVAKAYVSKGCKQVSDRLLEVGKIRAGFTVHDARRTIGTNLVEKGLADYDLVQQILNHKKNSVTDIYVRAKYHRQKKEVFSRWDELVRERVGLKLGAF